MGEIIRIAKRLRDRIMETLACNDVDRLIKRVSPIELEAEAAIAPHRLFVIPCKHGRQVVIRNMMIDRLIIR